MAALVRLWTGALRGMRQLSKVLFRTFLIRSRNGFCSPGSPLDQSTQVLAVKDAPQIVSIVVHKTLGGLHAQQELRMAGTVAQQKKLGAARLLGAIMHDSMHKSVMKISIVITCQDAPMNQRGVPAEARICDGSASHPV